MKRIVEVGAVAAILLVASPVGATHFLGWADKFVPAHVSCRSQTGNIACAIEEHWDHSGTWSVPTWNFVGQQGANTTGRAAAEEEVDVQFKDSDSGAYTSIVTLARYRTTSPPAEGSTCTGGSFVTSTSTTFTSTGFAGTDTYDNNRLLPVLNFSAETASSGTTIGYRSVVSAQYDNGGTPSTFSVSGCYSIFWN